MLTVQLNVSSPTVCDCASRISTRFVNCADTTVDAEPDGHFAVARILPPPMLHVIVKPSFIAVHSPYRPLWAPACANVTVSPFAVMISLSPAISNANEPAAMSMKHELSPPCPAVGTLPV